MMDGTDLETIERNGGWGQMTSPVRIEDTRRQEHAIEVTVYGWKVLLMFEPVTKKLLWPSWWGRVRTMQPTGSRPWSPMRRRILPATLASPWSSLIKAFWMAPIGRGATITGAAVWCPPQRPWR